MPAPCLLRPVVAPAQRREMALARPASLVVGDGVFVIALAGRAAAGGEGTLPIADGDEVPEPVAEPVTGDLPLRVQVPVSSACSRADQQACS